MAICNQFNKLVEHYCNSQKITEQNEAAIQEIDIAIAKAKEDGDYDTAKTLIQTRKILAPSMGERLGNVGKNAALDAAYQVGQAGANTLGNLAGSVGQKLIDKMTGGKNFERSQRLNSRPYGSNRGGGYGGGSGFYQH